LRGFVPGSRLQRLPAGGGGAPCEPRGSGLQGLPGGGGSPCELLPPLATGSFHLRKRGARDEGLY